MRFRLATLVAAFFALILASGCSNRVERLVGNQRLIRGSGSLGTTTLENSTPDRDTYVTPGTANYGTTLLVGKSPTFEARSFFRFLKFNLPDTLISGFSPDSVVFILPQNPVLRSPLPDINVELGGTTQALVDSGGIAWPGPAITLPLASQDFSFVGPLRLNLGPAFNQFKGWALDPLNAPAFALEATATGRGVGAFRADAAFFSLYYTWTLNGVVHHDSTNTAVSLDLYLHTPLQPPPTGSDTRLLLGAGFEPSVAIRAPVPAVASGASVNELRFVFSVFDSIPAVDGLTVLHTATDSTRVAFSLDAYQITGDWPETATDLSQIPYNTTPIASFLNVTAQPGDSLSIPIPLSLARVWFQNPAVNYGILISVRNANVFPGVVLGSRESAKPPVLRLSTTTAPPGRF
jgi:hypothetical protein